MPHNLDQPLARWGETLTGRLGDALQAIALYGGLAKGEFVEDYSDVNIVLILRRITTDVLDRAAPLVQQGALEFRLSCMLLTEADLRDSADVFPIKFLDMQRHHRMLWGEDPFAKVSVTRPHLAIRCEQELRNLALRLRQSYVTSVSRPERLRTTLDHAVSSLLVNLGVLVELKTGQRTDSKQEAQDKAESLGLPLAAVRQTWALKRGELHPDVGALKQLYGSFMDAVQQAAALASQLSR